MTGKDDREDGKAGIIEKRNKAWQLLFLEGASVFLLPVSLCVLAGRGGRNSRHKNSA